MDRSPAYIWLVTVTGLFAFFTMVFSSTLVNVAIPHAMGAFGIGQDRAQFLSTAFLATNTASLLINRWLIARVGQRSAFALSLLLFGVGSAICWWAPGFDLMVVGRIVQGLSAGIVQPLVMVVLFQVFPADRRGLAMGLFSMGVVFALGLGPAIGGVTIDLLEWRYIFLTPLPPAALALLLGFFFIPERAERGARQPFDALGFALIAAAIFLLTTGIASGQREGWFSNYMLAIWAGFLVTGAGFLISQRRPRANLLDLSLFANLRFAAAGATSFVFAFASFGTVYIFPVFGQIVPGYSATEAGALLLPGCIVAALLLPFAGRLSDRFPAPLIVVVGMSAALASAVLMAGADTDTVFWTIAGYLLVNRIGVALVTPSLNNTALAALSPRQLDSGAGLINLLLMLGGSCGINILVVVLERRIEHHSDAIAATQTAANGATRELLGRLSGMLHQAGLPDSALEPVALAWLGRAVSSQANMLGFQDGFLAVALFCLLPMLPVSVLIGVTGVRRPATRP